MQLQADTTAELLLLPTPPAPTAAASELDDIVVW
jgi:hypothetical protein